MSVTVLHISDLHRDPRHPITNTVLLNSLQCDLERYNHEEPSIPSADLIIASGDIVQGVASDASNPDDLLEEQYGQAFEFLSSLADTFVGGDHERVVIVPGNHDISFPHTVKSLKEVSLDISSPKPHAEMLKAVFSPNSSIRWSWDKLAFLEIQDSATYSARIDAFRKFYQRFYNGHRTYSRQPEDQVDIFDFPALNIIIAGFNSCYNNDPLNKPGAIHPECLAKAGRHLRDRRLRHRLRLAVWHHSTSGGPFDSDYMDSETLQVLIDNGFSVGFHGHEHKPQFVDERYRFGVGRKITVISAGTLCGGPGALRTGQPRAYNVVRIEATGNPCSIHQRKMHNEDFSSPIWGPGTFSVSGNSWIEFTVQLPPTTDSREDAVADLAEAEELIRNKQYEDAASLLLPILDEDSMARRLLLECLSFLDDGAAIISHFYPPTSSTEIIHVADALWLEKDLGRLKELLKSDIVLQSDDAAVADIRTKYTARLKQ